MKIFSTKLVEESIVSAVECDCCLKIYDDEMELQEFFVHEDIGGYSSVFGDMSEIELHLCQYCVKDLLGHIVRVS